VSASGALFCGERLRANDQRLSVTLTPFMSATSETLPPQLPTLNMDQSLERTLVAGIALGSFSALLLELALTRLFSVVLFYHFAFLAISIALLGLGAGGVYAHVWKHRLGARNTRRLTGGCSLLNAIVIPVLLEIVLHVPVALDLSWTNFVRLSVIYICSAVPFFLTGLQFAVIFSRESARVTTLYGADLTGGALACLAVVPLLNWMGAPNAILFAALVSAVAAIVWSGSFNLRSRSVWMSSALALLIIANSSGHLIDVVWAKGIRRKNVEFARWNAISRVEVDRKDDGAKVIVIDADANTFIMNADLEHWAGSQWEKNLMGAAAGVVNSLRPHGDYAIIGPGGGVDVLRAVANGSHSVTGIEINPIIANTIMRDRYADFAYHLYQRSDVHVHVADGRSFIRNAPSNYDVVQMTLVDTWASTAAGAFALSENSLYTTEAFREYFEHLKPDGIIAVTRWEFQEPREALRVVSVAMRALHGLGESQTSAHFMVISQGDLDKGGIPVTVLAKKSAFTAAEQAEVRHHLQKYSELKLLYSPAQASRNAFTELIKSNDPFVFSKQYAYNVAPVTDNAPFFFFTLKPEQIWRSISEPGAMDWKVNLGVAVLAMLLLISLVAVLAFLVVPLILQKERAGNSASLLYFVAIGLGYILVEITFIQRFVLFLGHPTYALTVVVFLMLLSSGAGSVASSQWIANPARVWLPLMVIVAALMVFVWILPPILNRLVGAPFPAKLLISAFMLAPLGFVMGMPFPAGLRALSANRGKHGDSIEWAWAMNAASSVLGSVLAIVIAIQFGLNVTLTCGAAAYLLALLLRGKLLGAPSTA
jgi:spermidine synthase